MTSSITAQMMAKSAYFIFRPWSHTDRRHVVALCGGPYQNIDALNAAAKTLDVKRPQHCHLEPIDTIDRVELVKSDAKRRARILKKDASPMTQKDLMFVGVSWSPRSPVRLNIESRAMALRTDAYNFSQTEATISGEPERIFMLMTLLDPVTADLSP